MPIHGLTIDRPPAFPHLGTLRKGAPSEQKTNANGKSYGTYGKDLEWFRFDTDDQAAAAKFTETYGNEPNHIRVFLPYTTVDENFQTWKEEWAAGGLVHRCDGVTAVRWRKPDGKYSDDPIPCPAPTKCKPVGRMFVVVECLKRFAYVTVLTSSIHDVIELHQNLQAAYAIRQNLQGIPFILSRKPREISTPDGKGGRRRAEKWLLSIEADSFWAGLQMAATEQAALPGHVQVISDGRYMLEETGEIFDQEDAPIEVIQQPVATTQRPMVLPASAKPRAGEKTATATQSLSPAKRDEAVGKILAYQGEMYDIAKTRGFDPLPSEPDKSAVERLTDAALLELGVQVKQAVEQMRNHAAAFDAFDADNGAVYVPETAELDPQF